MRCRARAIIAISEFAVHETSRLEYWTYRRHAKGQKNFDRNVCAYVGSYRLPYTALRSII